MNTGYSALLPLLWPHLMERQPPAYKPRLANGWYMFHSPLREGDDKPSFSLYPDSATSPGAWKDHATGDCGSIADLARRLGVDPRVSTRRQTPDAGRRIVATYDYRGADGHLLYQVVRYEPKAFRQRQPDGNGGWKWTLKGVEPVLYRLPELLAADPATPVLIVEGEKDVDRLVSLNRIATTNPMGAGKWRQGYNRHLRDRHVVIYADNDAPGLEHAARVARSLAGVSASVRVIRLAGLQEHGDVSDWLDAGHTPEELEEIIAATPRWEPPAEGTEAPTEGSTAGAITVCLADVVPQKLEFLWPARIARGKVTLLAGDPGLGKSFLTLDIAARLSTGTPLPGEDARPARTSTLLLSLEDDLADTTRPRLDTLKAGLTRIHAVTGIREGDAVRLPRLDKDLLHLQQKIAETGCGLVVVDPINAYMGATDGNDDIKLRQILTPLAALAARTGVAVLAVTHMNKARESAPLHRVMGSLAYVAAARSVLAVGQDPDEPGHRVLLQLKSNLAPLAPGIGFRIVEGALTWDQEPVSATAERVFGTQPAAREDAGGSKLTEAKLFLRVLLRHEGGRYPQHLIKAEAEQTGLAWATVRRAKDELGIRSERDKFGGEGQWHWSLPDDHVKPSGDLRCPGAVMQEMMSTLVPDEHLRDERAPDEHLSAPDTDDVEAF